MHPRVEFALWVARARGWLLWSLLPASTLRSVSGQGGTELEGVGGVTGYMDGTLVMGTSHPRQVLTRTELFKFNMS